MNVAEVDRILTLRVINPISPAVGAVPEWAMLPPFGEGMPPGDRVVTIDDTPALAFNTSVSESVSVFDVDATAITSPLNHPVSASTLSVVSLYAACVLWSQWSQMKHCVPAPI